MLLASLILLPFELKICQYSNVLSPCWVYHTLHTAVLILPLELILQETPIIFCKGRDTTKDQAKDKSNYPFCVPSLARKKIQQGTKQGYYPFCVSSLEGIRKAVIPSRDTSHYLLQGKGHNEGLSKG